MTKHLEHKTPFKAKTEEFTYNKTWIEDSIDLMESDIKDISTWDSYNDDLLSEDISELKVVLERIKEKVVNKYE